MSQTRGRPQAFLKRSYSSSKVPEIGVLFWVIKLCSTAFGEATSDFSVTTISPYLAVVLGAVVFACLIYRELLLPQFSALWYWLSVSAVAVFGTMLADALHVQIGIPYVVSCIVFGLILSGIFYLWHKSEGTIAIHSVITTRREVYYWATVVATFAFGTAAGDLTATSLSLGYGNSIILFGVLLLVPLCMYCKLDINSVACFWFAYILTRPLGASVADYLSKPSSSSGLGLGDEHSAIIIGLLLVFLIWLAIRQQRKLPTSSRRDTSR